MKVGELIENLNKFDKDKTVIFYHQEPHKIVSFDINDHTEDLWIITTYDEDYDCYQSTIYMNINEKKFAQEAKEARYKEFLKLKKEFENV